jgi:hypothetical protein
MRQHEFIPENSILAKAIQTGTKILKPAVQQVTKTAAPAIGQTFNFSTAKTDIVNRIARSLKAGQPIDVKDNIYGVLRNNNSIANTLVDQLGYTRAEKLAYSSALQKWPKSNFGWAQKDFGPAKAVGQGSSAGGRTENFYATITKDRANLDKFMKSFPDLDRRIQQLAQQTGQPISYKTNASLTGLAGDNDNLKLFYYDPKLKPQIEATVKQWLQANGIQTGARTHVHGADIGANSFGQLVTNHVNDSLNNLVKQYGNKYTPEQYYEWLGTNFKTLIGQVSVK